MLTLLFAACEKVPIQDIDAQFTLADVTWFQDEETMFVFYSVEALQGLSEHSRIELTYRTDELEQPWVSLDTLPKVHQHLPVNCGTRGLCGSASLRVSKAPRDVNLRLRYHQDGALTKEAWLVTTNVVGSGPVQLNRSLVLYGVFDETNSHVQWRARHQFPTLRNEAVQDLGLRRYFRVESPRFGHVPLDQFNPYLYGFANTCPDFMPALGWAAAQTTTRAIFSPEAVPVRAFDAPHLCGESTVLDGKGPFTTAVVAHKNPQVRPAFPSLRNPVTSNTVVGFTLTPCQRTISAAHLAMQRQRLLVEGDPQVCIDDWQDHFFSGRLVSTLRNAIDETRAAGRDMVLALVLHHDDATGDFDEAIESALEQILPLEAAKSSPRVSGAFVFDSFAHALSRPTVARSVLWCPADVKSDDLDSIPSNSKFSCPLVPDLPDVVIGPVKLTSLPVLPTRKQFEIFVSKYSADQAGKTVSLEFLAPVRTPISTNVPNGDFGFVTFFNNESFAAAPGDAFSFCVSGDPNIAFVAARIPELPDAPFSLSSLPQVHSMTASANYQLGLGWDFPFLVRLKYESVVAGAASAFSFSVPFGIGSPADQDFGLSLWLSESVPVGDALTQCTRFCDAPTFDTSGVYNVNSPFRTTYAAQCYRPLYPVFERDGGYPREP